jgi:hypothetical protein
MSAPDGGCKPLSAKTYVGEAVRLAPVLAPEGREAGNPLLDAAGADAELARILAAWPSLAAPLKAAILALVASASTTST